MPTARKRLIQKKLKLKTQKPKATKKTSKSGKPAKKIILKFAVLVLIIVGLIFLIYPHYSNLIEIRRININRNNNPKLDLSVQVSSTSSTLSTEPIKIDSNLLTQIIQSQSPLRIIIPQLFIDLPIIEAKVVNGYWETSLNTASHGEGSANPGQNGNIVIFAHAKPKLFEPLRNIQNGNVIYVLTKDRWFRYRVNEINFVNPKDIEVIKPTESEALTLFTCSGFLDEKRLIVKALPDYP